MARRTVVELERENRELREDRAVLLTALKETLWMARRYADGRMTFSASDINRNVRALLHRGFDVERWDGIRADGTPWARDGMGRAFDKLSDEEAARGKAPFDLWSGVRDERELLARELGAALCHNAVLRGRVRDVALAWHHQHCGGRFDRCPSLTCRSVRADVEAVGAALTDEGKTPIAER